MTDSSGVTILVVDDNPATRYSTSRILKSAGFIVREAATGQQALDMAQDAPQAVVLDVNLPDMDGFEVCKVLRRRGKTARTPIIHLSATFVAAVDKVQGLEAGADGYLTHPIEPPVLIATVNAFLRARVAEEQLRRSEEKFRTIFDQAVNGIALMNERLVYTEVNAAMCGTLGRDRADIVGQPMTRFVPDGHAGLDTQIGEAIARDGVYTGSFPVVRFDGGLVDLEWNISMHSLAGIRLAVVTDMTQRRAVEAERERLLASERAARTEAERANRLKDEFLATVSHELRSPLNAIVGWTRLLKLRGYTNREDYDAGIDAIDRNARVQAQLIADLLDVSRITSGKLRIDRRMVDLADVIAYSLDGVLQSALAKGIVIAQHVDDAGARVSGDPGRLQQIVDNLLTNAIKFTPSEGQVDVRLARIADHAEIVVSDNGQGISGEFLPYIFDSFRQEDAATTRAHEGLGLGLSIVKRLVELHNGSIEAHSDGVGRGATFTVRLPLVDAAAIAQSPAPGDAAANRDALGVGHLRVMVVDDDFDSRLLMQRHLSDYVGRVTEASSMNDALRLLPGTDPHVLITDISMPDEDGYELLRRVRAMGFSAERLPVIAVTAFARPEDRDVILQRGFQEHLAKPIDLDGLLGAVARLAHPLR